MLLPALSLMAIPAIATEPADWMPLHGSSAGAEPKLRRACRAVVSAYSVAAAVVPRPADSRRRVPPAICLEDLFGGVATGVTGVVVNEVSCEKAQSGLTELLSRGPSSMIESSDAEQMHRYSQPEELGVFNRSSISGNVLMNSGSLLGLALNDSCFICLG